MSENLLLVDIGNTCIKLVFARPALGYRHLCDKSDRACPMDRAGSRIWDISMDAYGSRIASSRDLMIGWTRYSMMRRSPARISLCVSMPGMSLPFSCPSPPVSSMRAR